MAREPHQPNRGTFPPTFGRTPGLGPGARELSMVPERWAVRELPGQAQASQTYLGSSCWGSLDVAPRTGVALSKKCAAMAASLLPFRESAICCAVSSTASCNRMSLEVGFAELSNLCFARDKSLTLELSWGCRPDKRYNEIVNRQYPSGKPCAKFWASNTPSRPTRQQNALADRLSPPRRFMISSRLGRGRSLAIILM